MDILAFHNISHIVLQNSSAESKIKLATAKHIYSKLPIFILLSVLKLNLILTSILMFG